MRKWRRTMSFKELKISEPILKLLTEQGYETPSPIQQQAIPLLLEGKDILGSAQTGTGKTAAFAIPIIQELYQKKIKSSYIKTLVLAPTRELASQINDSFVSYSKGLRLKTTVVFGGVRQKKQTDALTRGVDILVATPGRLLDLINQGFIDLSKLKHFVLDEADRMLDMGFVKDVERIIKYIPKIRQTMLFSATMPKEIIRFANKILIDPVRVSVIPVETTLDVITQSVFKVSKRDKISLLTHILKHRKIESALVFTRTKQWANKVTKALATVGIKAEAIHGNKSQSAREKALKNFKTKKIDVLVATDIAARGIDIDELSHVINYDLPEVPETYIHRIGRTGRAGFSGVAYSFCSPEEEQLLRDIQRHIKMVIHTEKDLFKLGIVKRISLPKGTSRSTSKKAPAKTFESKHYGNRSSKKQRGNKKGSFRRDANR